MMNNNHHTHVGSVVRTTADEFLKYRNFGRKSLRELEEVLANHGLRLGMKIKPGPKEMRRIRKMQTYIITFRNEGLKLIKSHYKTIGELLDVEPNDLNPLLEQAVGQMREAGFSPTVESYRESINKDLERYGVQLKE